ncbi:MAG: HNH endonuclease [Acidimicrobiia bacterium]|nr:HNH endonuclease [Acidimicrobiia bacterium]MDH4307826.1 HNH endonuclease [Acidimicrobiia bacterium]MDH5292805.1 HNH endonuclease [Acidimicrobiia bacterium]
MPGVLVLNASHEPLSVVSDRRALVLVFRGKAIALEHRSEVWRSERAAVQIPSVVRLTSFVHVPYQRNVPVTRRAVFGRDEYRCQYCEGPAESIDHVLPRSRGGQHTWDNVVACCRRCNVRKGSRLPAEAGLILARRPQAPRRHGWIYASAGRAIDPSWTRYLMLEAAG